MHAWRAGTAWGACCCWFAQVPQWSASCRCARRPVRAAPERRRVLIAAPDARPVRSAQRLGQLRGVGGSCRVDGLLRFGRTLGVRRVLGLGLCGLGLLIGGRCKLRFGASRSVRRPAGQGPSARRRRKSALPAGRSRPERWPSAAGFSSTGAVSAATGASAVSAGAVGRAFGGTAALMAVSTAATASASVAAGATVLAGAGAGAATANDQRSRDIDRRRIGSTPVTSPVSARLFGRSGGLGVDGLGRIAADTGLGRLCGEQRGDGRERRVGLCDFGGIGRRFLRGGRLAILHLRLCLRLGRLCRPGCGLPLGTASGARLCRGLIAIVGRAGLIRALRAAGAARGARSERRAARPARRRAFLRTTPTAVRAPARPETGSGRMGRETTGSDATLGKAQPSWAHGSAEKVCKRRAMPAGERLNLYFQYLSSILVAYSGTRFPASLAAQAARTAAHGSGDARMSPFIAPGEAAL